MDALAQTQPLASSSSAAIKAQLLSAALPAGGAPLGLDLALGSDVGLENRLVFASLRSTAALQAISLIDPAQRRLWRKTPAELGLTPKAHASHAELGDAILLPEVRNAAPGRWRLLLEPVPGAKGQVLLSYRLLPRHELSMSLVAATGGLAAGEPLLLALRAQDYGGPLTGLASLPLSLRGSRGELIATPLAEAGARTPAGVLLSQEPGVLIARFSLPAAGDYRLLAQHQFRADGKPLQAELALSATAAKAALALSGLRVETQAAQAGACVSAVVFDFAVQVAMAGSYACNISLLGPAATRMVSASAELAAGPGLVSVRVSADKLAALGRPLTRLARVGLIRFGPTEPGLVAELQELVLRPEQVVELKAFCKA